jgi:hypothetical protein
VLWHERIQAGHVDVPRKKSFIVGKGKGITCSPGKEGFPASRKRRTWLISGWFYTTLHLEAGRDCELRARGRRWACDYLAQEKELGVIPVHTYVNSQVPHP